MSQQKENNIVQNINMDNIKKIPLNALSGYIYQTKLLMLFMCRGISRKYSFRLGAEIVEAKKFDDLVFEYSEGGEKLYRLLQAKHSSNERKKITVKNLLDDPDNDYDLIKYYVSYQDSKKQELFKNGRIKDIIICTNIGFNVEELKKEQIDVEKIVDKDDILDIKCVEKKSVRYKFKQCVADKLRPKLKAYSSAPSGRRLPKKPISYSDEEIKDFLDHFVFAINQPNQEQLGEIIKEEIGKEFDIITTENVYNKLYQKMTTWLTDKNSSPFMSHEEGSKFFYEEKIGCSIWFDVKDPVMSFSGRTRELDDLHILLQGPDTAGTSPLVSITGLGGVGKTEFVRKYINKYAADYDNKVIWMNAESYENLVDSFRRLSRDTLKISTKNVANEEKEMESIVEDVYKFVSHGKSLFVFDNAEKYRNENDVDFGIEQFLPSSSPTYNRPYVLISSRNKSWSEHIKVLQLDVFSEEEAMQFIKTSLKLNSDAQEEDIKELAVQLHFLPLALQQAIAYIKHYDLKWGYLGSKFEIRDYLVTYNEKANEVLEFTIPKHSNTDHTRTVFRTWNITLGMIKLKEGGKDALKILAIISYLAPENIPTKIFSKLITDVDKLTSAIRLLDQYSMVNSEHAMLNVHRLVQLVIRMKVEKENRKEKILQKVVQLFDRNDTSKHMRHAMRVFFHLTSDTSVLQQEFSNHADYISQTLMPGKGTTWKYSNKTGTYSIFRPKQKKVSTVETAAGGYEQHRAGRQQARQLLLELRQREQDRAKQVRQLVGQLLQPEQLR